MAHIGTQYVAHEKKKKRLLLQIKVTCTWHCDTRHAKGKASPSKFNLPSFLALSRLKSEVQTKNYEEIEVAHGN